MAIKIKTKNNKEITLLNPNEKANKIAKELKGKKRLTNDGKVKKNEDGSAQCLTPTGAAWRMGYLQARKDNAKCFKANQKKKK